MPALSLRRSVFTVLASVLSPTSPAFAQIDTGTIVGRVVDDRGGAARRDRDRHADRTPRVALRP